MQTPMAKDAEKPRESNSKPAGANKPELRKTDEDPVGKVYDSRLIKRLGHYLRPYWLQAAISSVSGTRAFLKSQARRRTPTVGSNRPPVHAPRTASAPRLLERCAS